MKDNTNSKEFTNPETGDKVRFDPGVEGADGYKGTDHYHRYNPNATGKGDYYLDVNDNPVKWTLENGHLKFKGSLVYRQAN